MKTSTGRPSARYQGGRKRPRQLNLPHTVRATDRRVEELLEAALDALRWSDLRRVDHCIATALEVLQ